jgi:hypothetical protein
MKPYSDYSAEELAMENLFIRWVRFPDDPSIRTFWENWIVKYPYMKANVDRARELVLTASDWKPDSLSNQEVNSLWGRIRTSLEIIGERETTDQDDPFFSMRSWTARLVTGLGVAVFLFFVVYFVLK